MGRLILASSLMNVAKQQKLNNRSARKEELIENREEEKVCNDEKDT